jgi:hypothetical protein
MYIDLKDYLIIKPTGDICDDSIVIFVWDEKLKKHIYVYNDQLGLGGFKVYLLNQRSYEDIDSFRRKAAIKDLN